jgi:hypothetical protein
MSNRDYYAYVLRLWRRGRGQPWHATLENSYVEERHSFGTLGQLVAFLMETTDSTLDIPTEDSDELANEGD